MLGRTFISLRKAADPTSPLVYQEMCLRALAGFQINPIKTKSGDLDYVGQLLGGKFPMQDDPSDAFGVLVQSKDPRVLPKVLEVYKRKTRTGDERDRLLDLEGIIQTLEALLMERVPAKRSRRKAKGTWRSKINEVAHVIAKAEGWSVEDGLDFETSKNPRARQFWGMAMIAYEGFFGDKPDLDAEIED